MNATGYPQTELVSCYNRLTLCLTELADGIRSSELPLWVPLSNAETAAGLSAREKAVRLYCDIWYVDGQDGRRTHSCHGLVAASQQIIDSATRVNNAKQAFQRAVSTLRNQPDADEQLQQLNQRDPQLRDDLRHKGLGRLHLKQCYRAIPLIAQHPSRIGFNWYSSGRSIKRLSVTDAEKMLIRAGLDKPHIQLQHDQLMRLPASTPLARVQQQAPLMRANLRFDHQHRDADRNAMNLSLPLLFLCHPGRPFPDHNEPPLQPPPSRQREVRSDCLIEESAFLPTLRIHRYREH